MVFLREERGEHEQEYDMGGYCELREQRLVWRRTVVEKGDNEERALEVDAVAMEVLATAARNLLL